MGTCPISDATARELFRQSEQLLAKARKHVTRGLEAVEKGRDVLARVKRLQ